MRLTSRDRGPRDSTPLGTSVPLYAESHGALAAPPPGITASLPKVEVATPDGLNSSGDALTAVVWADLTGQEFDGITRATAMAIPSVARQRHLIAGSLARCPLVEMIRDTPAPEPAPWMQRTDSLVSPYHRMLWTVDDLIFGGWSLWARYNDAAGRLPLDMSRVPTERWRFTKTGGIETNLSGEWKPARAAEVVLIPGPHEGICNFGAPAIRMARDNAKSASTAARNPSAYLNLHYTGDEPMKPEDRAEMIQAWVAARRGENGGVAYTNKFVEVQELGSHESHLLIEGRNADAVDMSRLISSPAAMADATNAGASLTYETTEGRNGQFIDYGVALYADSIVARLSLDDVTAHGRRVAFDFDQLTNVAPADTGAPTVD